MTVRPAPLHIIADTPDTKLPAWKDVPIHTSIKRGMLALQFTTPTEIQQRAVPFAMEGRDVVGVAETVSNEIRTALTP